MPGVVVLRGPAPGPDAPLGWCVVCAGQVKNDAVEGPLKHKIASVRNDQAAVLELDPMPGGYPTDSSLAPAVAFGLYMVDMPGIGMIVLQVPLCWTHLLPLNVGGGTSLARGSAADAAALEAAQRPRGPGGAAMLGGGR